MGDSMYNEKVKTEFTEWYSTQNKMGIATIRSVLERFADAEQSVQKDVCEFSKEEFCAALQDFFDDVDAVRHATAIIRAYAKWHDISSGVFDVVPSDVDLSPSLSRIVVQSPTSLFEEISKVRTFDDGFPEPVLIALAWCGLSWTETISLLDSVVDLERLEISIDGGILPIDPEPAEVLRLFRNCKYSYRDNRMGSYQVIKDMTTDKFLKKFLSPNSNKFGMEFTRSQLDTAMGKLLAVYEGLGEPPRLSYKNVLRSGGFYRLRNLELSGVDIFDAKNKALVRQTYRAPKDYNSLRIMYRFYKRAFNLE